MDVQGLHHEGAVLALSALFPAAGIFLIAAGLDGSLVGGDGLSGGMFLAVSEHFEGGLGAYFFVVVLVVGFASVVLLGVSAGVGPGVFAAVDALQGATGQRQHFIVIYIFYNIFVQYPKITHASPTPT